MAKNKLRKFREMDTFKNVVQPKSTFLDQDIDLKGRWNKDFFKNNNPIVIELGCGKGEYSVGLAERYPEKNFIGIDIKGNRLWKGATVATNQQLNNIGFLRLSIQNIKFCFTEGEVDEIWITFPDPQIKRRRSSKRLTHPSFLHLYKNILCPNGFIHLKTDSRFLYGYTMGILNDSFYKIYDSTHDLYSSSMERNDIDIITFYEKKFLDLGLPINYIKFGFA